MIPLLAAQHGGEQEGTGLRSVCWVSFGLSWSGLLKTPVVASDYFGLMILVWFGLDCSESLWFGLDWSKVVSTGLGCCGLVWFGLRWSILLGTVVV